MKSLKTVNIVMFAALSWQTIIAGTENSASQLSLTTSNGRRVDIEFLSENILRVTNTLPSLSAHETGASVLTPTTVAGRPLTLPDGWKGYATDKGLQVMVEPLLGGVYIMSDGKLRLYDNGNRLTSSGETSMQLFTTATGSFYGAGERGHKLNLRGDTLTMYNRQNYGYTGDDPRISQMGITMPLFISDSGFAVVFDDHSPARMILGDPIVYTTEASNPVSYYFVNSTDGLEGTVRELSSLTGRQSLPPFWALGYITSRYGYRTQKETTGVVDTLRRSGYPVDGIVLDLYWYGKEQDMGRLAWDKDQWPDHRKMLTQLKKKGVNTVLISQPYILRNAHGIDNYNELASGGMLLKDSLGAGPQEVKIWVGEGGMFDVANPGTRAWLSNRYRMLTDEGVGGWWGDLGEPEVHPENAIHANGLTARQYHNKYGNDWSRIIYDLYKKEYPSTRLMTMMRGGTTGLQRYNVFPWSTDVSRSWGGMQPQIRIMLNSGLSGLGYMSHDVGGFAIDPDNPIDPELYVRWLQLGLFSPVLRTHAQQTAEPYKYPEEQHIILPLIKERYRWLPYNYTLAWENASQGLPLVRPLNFYADGDDIETQYLWGRDVMIAPVLEQGATSRKITMPAEGVWLDMTDPSKAYEASETINYDAPLNVIPMFVRAGAFIPKADYDMANTGDYLANRYEINYYPHGTIASSFTMFDDDRTSATSLADGSYRLITFKGDTTPGAIHIDASAEGHYRGAPDKLSLTFRIHATVRPTKVIAGQKTIKTWTYDDTTHVLTIGIKWETTKPLQLDIKQ